MRCFECNDNTHIVILGEDLDDHDVWVTTSDDAIELIGTLKKAGLRRLHDTMLMKRVKLSPKDFEFLQPRFKAIEWDDIRRVSMRLLEGSYHYTEFCTKCSQIISNPIEPCACDGEHFEKLKKLAKLPLPQ